MSGYRGLHTQVGPGRVSLEAKGIKDGGMDGRVSWDGRAMLDGALRTEPYRQSLMGKKVE